MTCGQGKQTRRRSKSPAKDDGAECDGESLDAEVCNKGPCRKFYKQLVFIGTLWRHWDIATLTCLLPHFLQLLTASGMDGVIGPPAQRPVTKGNRREGDQNHQQNTAELSVMANLWKKKFVITRNPVVSFTFIMFFFRDSLDDKGFFFT